MTRQSILVFGGSGFVGSRVRALWQADRTVISPSHAQLDLLNSEAVAEFVKHTDAQVVLNLAAGANVDGSERERGDEQGGVYRLNAVFPAQLARLCADSQKHLVHISTDYVFDGANAQRPYLEGDPTNPLGWYAQTKAIGEQAVLDAGSGACVARIEMPFSGHVHPKLDFPRICVSRLHAGQPITGVLDQNITPVFLDDAVNALGCLADARYTGLIHVAAATWTTPYQLARSIANRLGFDANLVQSEAFEMFVNTRPARRPQHSWLDVSRFAETFGADILRPVDVELDAWVEQLRSMPSQSWP